MNDKDKKIMEDIMNLDLSLKDRFNLLLVFRRKRPACILDVTIKDSEGRNIEAPLDVQKKILQDIRKKFPFFVITLFPNTYNPQLGDIVFVSRKKLPIRKKNETGCHWRGRVLGYDVPMENLKGKKRKFNKYSLYELYKNDVLISKDFILHTEKVNFFNQINPQKLKDFDQVAKEVGYRVKLVKEKVERK